MLATEPLQRARSFSHVPFVKKKTLQPLSRQFFSQLIKLESELHHQDYTLDTLDEITEYYATAVEYYDAVKDEIASYFVFKIQDALATKKSLKMLMDQNLPKEAHKEENSIEVPAQSSSPNLKKERKLTRSGSSFQNSIIREDSIEESGEEECDREIMELERQRIANQSNRKMRVSISKMKEKNQRTVTLHHKVEREKKVEQKNLNKALDTYKCSSKGNDDLIIKELETQKNKLRQKLEQRKNASFAALAISNSFTLNRTLPNNSFTANDRKGLDYVLRELENCDETLICREDDYSPKDGNVKLPTLELDEREYEHKKGSPHVEGPKNQRYLEPPPTSLVNSGGKEENYNVSQYGEASKSVLHCIENVINESDETESSFKKTDLAMSFKRNVPTKSCAAATASPNDLSNLKTSLDFENKENNPLVQFD